MGDCNRKCKFVLLIDRLVLISSQFSPFVAAVYAGIGVLHICGLSAVLQILFPIIQGVEIFVIADVIAARARDESMHVDFDGFAGASFPAGCVPKGFAFVLLILVRW